MAGKVKKSRAERAVAREAIINNFYQSICRAMLEVSSDPARDYYEVIEAGERCIENHLRFHPDKRAYIIEARNRVKALLTTSA